MPSLWLWRLVIGTHYRVPLAMSIELVAASLGLFGVNMDPRRSRQGGGRLKHCLYEDGAPTFATGSSTTI